MPPYYTIRNLLLNLQVSMLYIYEGENVLIFHQHCYLQDIEKYDAP